MQDFLIQKGMKIKVDFNYSRFEGPQPVIKEVFITWDDEPRLFSQCKYLLVGKTMKEYITIGSEQVVLENHQPSLF